MPAAVQAIRLRPLLYRFLAVKKYEDDVIDSRRAGQRICQLEQKTCRRSAVIRSDEVRQDFGVVVAGDDDRLAGFAWKTAHDISHRHHAVGGGGFEVVKRNG